jgi:uncharacterized protein (DUF924 family)
MERVLAFWLGELDPRGVAAKESASRWWKQDPEFDLEVRQRFERQRRAILAGDCEEWLGMPRGRLAYVIVLDQFSRNMYRDTAEAFSADSRALQVAREGVDIGVDRLLGVDERTFFYMPYMHSEEIEAQEECVALFEAFMNELSGELRGRVQRTLDYAIRHRDIVARFGRFPHRNQALGRVSTEAELVFLSQPGSRF